MSGDHDSLSKVAKFLRYNGFAYKRHKTQLTIYTTTCLFEKIKADVETIIRVEENKKMLNFISREQEVFVTTKGKVIVIDNMKLQEELCETRQPETYTED